MLSNINNENSYKLFVETPAGYKSEKKFKVIRNTNEPELTFDNLPVSISRSKIEISGTAINTDELLINNKAVNLEGKNFKTIIELIPGNNKIFAAVKNSFGFTKSYQRDILLDKDAPVLINKNIKIESADNFGIIKITAEVSDKSELRRTAEVNYNINGESFKAYLRLSGQSNVYEGIIQVLKSQINDYKLISITFEDYLGNKESYNF